MSMGKEFSVSNEARVPASPDEIWDAIATGPGIDSWYMGRSTVEPGVAVATVMGEYTPVSPVTAWEPGSHLAYGAEAEPDGRFVAFEFLIEGRERASTVLRMVAHGFLPGDDWAEEFEAMSKGGQLYWHTLVAYLTHFAGRYATPLMVAGPTPQDWDAAWVGVGRALGLSGRPVTGDTVRLQTGPDRSADGTVFYANDHVTGVRTADGLYRFLRGFHGPMLAFHECFDSPADPAHWSRWLQGALA
jgi:uncharacterized protein YndB with AHSA1/START domain